MNKFTSVFLALSILFCGCSTFDEPVTNVINDNLSDLYASFEEDTRTYVENNKYLRWHEDDRLTAFYGNTLNRQYKFKGQTGDNSGTFSLVPSGELGTGNTIDRIYALYPYSETAKITDEGEISLTLPDVQNYAENSFGRGANTMIAVTENKEDTFLGFKNACGYLKLKLYGEDVTLASIEIKGNNDEKIAGAATATMVFGSVPTVTMADDATTTITLDCGDGIAIGQTAETATEFWVVIPETTFTKGVTIKVTDSEGGVFEKSTDKEVVITRNEIQPMAAVEVECINVENCKIYYTATAKVTPYNTNAFGVNIISNEWDESTGEGVITFDGEVTSIDKEAFARNKEIINMTIPNSVTLIGYDAFLDCDNLVKISIPESVLLIDTYAFLDCDGLTEVVLHGKPDIGYQTFAYCDNLSNIYCKSNTPPTIGKGVFFYCYIHIYVPESYDNSILNAYKSAEGWMEYSLSIQEYDFENDGSLSVIKKMRYSATEKIIPYAVNAFGASIVSNEWDITTGDGVITFDGNISSIGNNAFYNCSCLTNITIPASVTSIGDNAFYMCSNLTSITIPENVSQIGNNVFSGCGATELIIKSKFIESDCTYEECPADNSTHWLKGSHFTNITFGDNITKIGDYAFCGYTTYSSWEISITLPTSITYIGNWAFSHCNIYNISSDLTNVHLIGDGAFYQSYFNYKNYIKLNFSDKLQYIGEHAFAYSDIDAIYLNATTPPIIVISSSYNESPFIGFDEDSNYVDPACDIYIPQGSLNAYINSDWQSISYYLNEYSF